MIGCITCLLWLSNMHLEPHFSILPSTFADYHGLTRLCKSVKNQLASFLSFFDSLKWSLWWSGTNEMHPNSFIGIKQQYCMYILFKGTQKSSIFSVVQIYAKDDSIVQTILSSLNDNASFSQFYCVCVDFGSFTLNSLSESKCKSQGKGWLVRVDRR